MACPPALLELDWDRAWWCDDCLQAKCSAAWNACKTRDTDHLVLDDDRIAAYRARMEREQREDDERAAASSA